MDNQTQIPVPPVEMPWTMARARIDDKGRIKLAADFVHFFEALPERKVFVTTTDGRIAEIYPISTWRETAKFLAANEKDPAARRAAFRAAKFGTVCEVDGQGRVTVNADLRRELKLDGQDLHILAHKQNRIRILSAEAYEAMEQDLRESDGDKDEDALLALGRP